MLVRWSLRWGLWKSKILHSQWEFKERLHSAASKGEMTARFSCLRGEISGVPVKWQDVETPTQEWALLTTLWGSRTRTDRRHKEESGRRDWAEERSDGTVVNPPTWQWDPAEYIKWNGGRFGSRETDWCFVFFCLN